MNYNNKEKRTTKTVEINNIELQKCRDCKRFKVDVITKHKSIIVDPPRGMPRWFKSWSEKIFEPRMGKVESTLERHDAMFKEHGWIK